MLIDSGKPESDTRNIVVIKFIDNLCDSTFLQMVQGAKDGSIVERLKSGGEECLPACVLVPWMSYMVGRAAKEDCFSSSSTVQTPSGVIAIKNLRLNDSVLTFTPGLGAHYTEVDSLQFHIKDISLFNIFAMYDMKHIKGRK